MAKMVKITCKCGCGKTKMVRKADRDRGWGLFFSKSCKARWQEKRTGQNRAFRRGHGVSHAAKMRGEDPGQAVFSYAEKHGLVPDWDEMDDEMGWDAHKDTF